MKNKQTILNIIVALLLVLTSFYDTQIAFWLAVAFLIVYGFAKLRERKNKHHPSSIELTDSKSPVQGYSERPCRQ